MMKNELLSLLSKNDLCELMCLSYRSLQCHGPDDLELLISNLKKLFHFENALFVSSNVIELLNPNHNSPKLHVNDVSYPVGYMDLYIENSYFKKDAAFLEWITNLNPVNWLEVDKKCDFNYPSSVSAIDFNMNDGWTTGTLDLNTLDCYGFYLASDIPDKSVRTLKIIEYITPFFSEAYKNVLKQTMRCDAKLTKREIEVLNWVKEGKSSWEISIIISCSKRTVDFHITNIKEKLNAVTRSQAVAVGLKNGIINF
jgi:DNA-binding CsgD family transcriptional regulator